MKSLIVLVVGLLSVGCTSLRDSVVGEYKNLSAKRSYKLIYYDNGFMEAHYLGKKEYESKWSIVDGEMHVKSSGVFGVGIKSLTYVYRINTDKSITDIARIFDGKRTDYSKEDQSTWKKIK